MLIIDPGITDERILKGEAMFTGKNKAYCGGCGVAVDADIDNYCWKCGTALRPTQGKQLGKEEKTNEVTETDTGELSGNTATGA